MYYDRTVRDTVIFTERLDTYDIDLQQHFELGERNDFVVGAGYRFSADRLGNSTTLSFNPDHPNSKLFDAFAQDEITLVEKRLRLTLGARLEHNDYTGVEFQPDARLAWTPDERQTIWGAVSRAVRTPSEADEFVTLGQVIPPNALGPGNPPVPVPATIHGNTAFESEVLTAYQLGYRIRPCASLSLDLTGYYNMYDHLRSEEIGPGVPVPIILENLLHGETYGIEAAPTWQVCDWWRLQPAYTLLKMHLGKDPGSTDPTSVSTIEGESPQQQFSLRSSMDLPQNISFDLAVRYVDRLPAFNINSYVALDVRVAWRPVKQLELSVVGQNLGSPHAEFNPTFISTQQTDVRPSVYGKVTWHF
jgi:iron complex outermembrane receptor protein